jgi:hypothetical protein
VVLVSTFLANRCKWLCNSIANYKLQAYRQYYNLKNNKCITQREISIVEDTRGGFGNKIFHLNNLLQISNKYQRDAVSNYWFGLDYLDVPALLIKKPAKGIVLTAKHTQSIKELDNLLSSNINIHLDNNFLHNHFFDFCVKKPRELIFVKEKYKIRMQKKYKT